MAEPTKRIFVSSPGDVSQERALAFRVIKRLQRDFVKYFRLIPVFWEKLPLEAAECFQAEIERISSPAEADIVVFILWSRLGTPLGPQFYKPNGSLYNSGTEYEFEVSMQAHRDKGAPAILVYIKEAPFDPGKFNRDEVNLLDEFLAQTRKVNDFIEQRFYDSEKKVFIRSYHKFKEPLTFESQLEEHLRELLSRFLPGDAAVRPLWEGSPFRGLKVFDYEHEDIFFGRNQAALDILHLLQRQAENGVAFALVLGRSGSGKSSLVRSGVLPLLTRYGVVPEVGVWRWAVTTPSQTRGDIFEGLSAAILGPTALPELHTQASVGTELAQALRENPNAALMLLRDCLNRLASTASETCGVAPTSRLVLIIDQLEEIFSDVTVTSSHRQAYARLFRTLAQSGLIWIVATLRSDYYQRCAELSDLMALKKDGQYDLGAPSPTELQEIISQPANMARLRFETHPDTRESLDQHIFNAVLGIEAGLPLLEYTLEELYERSIQKDGLLTFKAYNDLGGVEGALGQRAEEVFRALPSEVQAAFPGVFQKLTSIVAGIAEKTEKVAAISASWDDLTSTPVRRQLVEAMVAARLFTADQVRDSAGVSQAIVRVAHEALFRAWKRLQDWLEQEKENLRVRSRVGVALDRWEAENRRPDLLLPAGKPLEEALPLLRAELSPEKKKFIQTSRNRARRFRHLKQTAVALLVGLCLAIGILLNYSNEQRKTNLSRQLSAQANDLRTQRASLLSRSVLLSLESLKFRDESVEGIQALQRGASLQLKLKQPPLYHEKMDEDEGVKRIALSPDGKYLAAIIFKRRQVFLYEQVGQRDKVQWQEVATQEEIKHEDEIWSIVFSPNHNQGPQRLATVGWDGKIKIWEAPTWKLITPSNMMHNDKVIDVAFHPKAPGILATISNDGCAIIWSERKNWINSPTRLPHHVEGRPDLGNPVSLAFNHDGTILATGTGKGLVQLWDANTGTPIGDSFRHEKDKAVYGVKFSHDGQLLASAGMDGMVKVWAVASRTHKGDLVHSGPAGPVVFSHDDKFLATGSEDNTARVWDLTSYRELIRVFHEPSIRFRECINVAFSPDARYLATGCWDKTARLWERDTGREVARLEHDDMVSNIVFHPKENLLFTASWDNKVRIWELPSSPPEFDLRHKRDISSVFLMPDGKRLLTGNDDATVRLWTKVDQQIDYTRMEMKPDNNFRPLVPVPDYAHLKGKKNVQKGPGRVLAISASGPLVATGSDDWRTRLWNVEEKRQIKEFEHQAGVWAVALNRNGRYLATGAGDLCVWDLEKDTLRYSFCEVINKDDDLRRSLCNASINSDELELNINSLAFSSINQLLAGSFKLSVTPEYYNRKLGAGRLNNKYFIAIWRLLNGSIELDKVEIQSRAECLAFSPDNNFLVAGCKDSNAWIWRVADGKFQNIKKLPHESEVIFVAFSPDGKYLATVSLDRIVRVWEVPHNPGTKNWREIARFYREEFVRSLVFSTDSSESPNPEYKFLVTSGKDLLMHRWLWRKEDIKNFAQDRLIRDQLSSEEKKQYLGDQEQFLGIDRFIMGRINGAR